MNDLINAVFHAAAGDSPGWRMWPFTSMGYQGGFWPVASKLVLVGLIFGTVALFLRFLFGPGGWLREEGWETTQEAKARENKTTPPEAEKTDEVTPR